MIWKSRYTALHHLNLLLGETRVQLAMDREVDRAALRNMVENESMDADDILAKNKVVGPERKLVLARLMNTMYKMTSELTGEKLSKKKLMDMGELGIGLTPNLSWPGMQLLLQTTWPWLKAERMKNVNRDALPPAAAALNEYYTVKEYRHLLMDEVVHQFRNDLFKATSENETPTMLVRGRQRVWNWVDGLFDICPDAAVIHELDQSEDDVANQPAKQQQSKQQQQQQQQKGKGKGKGKDKVSAGAEGSKRTAVTSKKSGIRKKQTSASAEVGDADVEDSEDDEVQIIEAPKANLQAISKRRQELQADQKTICALITRIEMSPLTRHSYMDGSKGPIVKDIHDTLDYLSEVSDMFISAFLSLNNFSTISLSADRGERGVSPLSSRAAGPVRGVRHVDGRI